MEHWAPVLNHPGYFVSDHGAVLGRQHGRKLSPAPNGSGHLTVSLFRPDGKRRTRLVHHLVLEAFVGPRPPGTEGCHHDDNHQNNHLSNLRWDTRQANKADARRNGRIAMGERMGTSKLTELQVLEIRRRAAEGERVRSIGRVFGVCHTTVVRIVRREAWAHVTWNPEDTHV